jgi:predicted nucleotidyltransferase
MRLNPDQVEIIRHATRDAFGSGAQVFLFGSRVDDNKRGGDVDLLIHPVQADHLLSRKMRFLGLLERQLGERKIDVVIEAPDDARPIVQVAHETGVRL